jgi:hypothetical protein
MIDNPFSLIDRRLNKIESILLEIKNEVKITTSNKPISKSKKKPIDNASNSTKKEVANG